MFYIYICVFHRNLLDKEEITKLKNALEHDEGIMKHSYGRDDGEGGRTKVCLWHQPGDDITGIIGRSEKMAGTFEQVSKRSEATVCPVLGKPISDTGSANKYFFKFIYPFKFELLRMKTICIYNSVAGRRTVPLSFEGDSEGSENWWRSHLAPRLWVLCLIF